MQTKTKIIALTCVITILFSSSFAFANDSGTSSTSSSSSSTSLDSSFIAPIPGASKLEPYAGLWGFIKKNTLFTQEEYKKMMSIFSYYNKQVTEVFANSSLTKEEINTKIYVINKSFFVALKPYIDSTKMADFEKWMELKLTTSSNEAPKPAPQPAPTNSGSTENGLFAFLKKKVDMTDSEYKAMNEAMAYNTKMLNAIYADKNLTQEQRLAKSMEIHKAFYAALRIYVVTTKLEAYDAWVANKLATNNGYGTGVSIPENPDNNYPPKPTGDTKPNDKCLSISDYGTNLEIKLSAKIAKAYMVSLEWSDYFEKGDEDLLGYKIVIKNAKGVEKVVSVDADTTWKDDWSSTAGINIYKVYAITNDGTKHESNSVIIPMNGNGWYDFSLTTRSCNPKPASDNDSVDVSKIVSDAQKLGPNIVNKIKFKYKLLSEKTRQLVNKKIDSIAKEKREEFLKKLLVKIDKLISTSKSGSLIAKLVELKQVIQERLDELTGTGTDDSVINELLNDSSAEDTTTN